MVALTLRLPTLSRSHLNALVVKVFSALGIILRARHCTAGLASRVVVCCLGLRLSLGVRLLACTAGKRQCQRARGDDPHGQSPFSGYSRSATLSRTVACATPKGQEGWRARASACPALSHCGSQRGWKASTATNTRRLELLRSVQSSGLPCNPRRETQY